MTGERDPNAPVDDEGEPEGDGPGDPAVEGGDSNIEDDAGEADKGKA